MIAGGILPVLAPFIPRIVIDNMVAGSDLWEIFQNIIVITAISLLLAIISVICDNIKFVQFIDLRMLEFYDLNERFLQINYEHLEDPSFLDRYQTATTTLNSNNEGFEGAYHNIFALLPLFFLVYYFPL